MKIVIPVDNNSMETGICMSFGRTPWFLIYDTVPEKIWIKLPVVQDELCNGCKKCVEFCKFNALAYVGKKLLLFEDVCHSCGGCLFVCPEKALKERDAFIKLSKAKAYADCDVDAPNLHLVLAQPSEPIVSDYFGLPNAVINNDECIKCGLCSQNCRFDAILKENGEYKVNPFLCEGCSVCEYVCPAGTISLIPAKAGEMKLFENPDVFSTAQLMMGSGTSGKLVTEVKNQLKNRVEEEDIVIIDGSPGIGCPVIASISGVDMVLIVAEPTISGISDMERIIKTCYKFGTLIAICVNKYDVNLTNTEKIEIYCATNKILYLGRIPFDPDAVKAINKGMTIVDIKCLSGYSAEMVFYKVFKLLYEN